MKDVNTEIKAVITQNKVDDVVEEIVTKAKTPAKAANSEKIDLRKLPRKAENAAARGTLPKPNSDVKMTYEQLKAIEEANTTSYTGRAAHGVSDHVEISIVDTYKKVEPVSEGGLFKPKHSKYNSPEEYTNQVNRMLKEKSQEIKDWLKDPNSPDFSFELPPEDDRIIGLGAKRNSNFTTIGTKPKFVLRKNDNGYFIHTSYPN
jgi:hypothetical protein